ncbi:hypothetical protein C8F01DRAFT_1257846 [Mycena amicta]|nr:hypothetical protein C8F01DRAFT_1257846 [Mycena amicta]
MFSNETSYEVYLEERQRRKEARAAAESQGVKAGVFKGTSHSPPSESAHSSSATSDSSSTYRAVSAGQGVQILSPDVPQPALSESGHSPSTASHTSSANQVTFENDTPSIRTASLHTPYPPFYAASPRNITTNSSSYSIHHYLLRGTEHRAIVTPANVPRVDITASLERPTLWDQFRHIEHRTTVAVFRNQEPRHQGKEVLRLERFRSSEASPLFFVVTSVPKQSLLVGDHIWFVGDMQGKWTITGLKQRDYLWCDVEFYSSQLDATLVAWVLPYYFNRTQPHWRTLTQGLASEFGQGIAKRFKKMIRNMAKWVHL